jgi:hypothetical protein
MREAVQAWLEDWRVVDSGADHYRLLFREKNVLYCEDLASGVVSAYVEGALDTDRPFLRGLGPIVTDEAPKGIRVHVSPDRIDELLRWCAAREPALWPPTGNLRGSSTKKHR